MAVHVLLNCLRYLIIDIHNIESGACGEHDNKVNDVYKKASKHQMKGYFERSSFDTGRLLGTGGNGARGGGGNWARVDIASRIGALSFPVHNEINYRSIAIR